MTKGATKKAPSLMEELQTKNIQYRYIPRRVFNVDPNSRHVLRDGMLDGANTRFTVRRDPMSGRYILPLTDEEKEYISKGLNIAVEELNPNIRDNPFFKGIEIEMPKHGLRLSLIDPMQFLYDKVLQTYDNIIAKGLSNTKRKPSFRFVRVDETEETDIYLEVSDKRKEAYKLLGALEENRNRMLMYILNSGRRVNPQISTKELRKQVNQLVEDSYTKFINVLEDPHFEVKGLINMATITGVIEERRGLYFFQQEPLAAKGKSPTILNACDFLEDKTNGNVRLEISKATLDGFSGA